MSDTTAFSDDECFEILNTDFTKLNPVFGLFILSIEDQIVRLSVVKGCHYRL